MKIWSKRYSAARGHHWAVERECDASTAQQWLDIFKRDEPDVVFTASKRKPKARSFA